MESKTENPQQSGGAQTPQLQASSVKVFMRGSADAPSPEYANNVEFNAVGMDVFMDVGTVSPETIKDAMQTQAEGKQLPTVKFNVDFRFGMSLQTAMVMYQRLTELLNQSAAGAKASLEMAKKDKGLQTP
jgi:hypothetical protein